MLSWNATKLQLHLELQLMPICNRSLWAICVPLENYRFLKAFAFVFFSYQFQMENQQLIAICKSRIHPLPQRLMNVRQLCGSFSHQKRAHAHIISILNSRYFNDIHHSIIRNWARRIVINTCSLFYTFIAFSISPFQLLVFVHRKLISCPFFLIISPHYKCRVRVRVTFFQSDKPHQLSPPEPQYLDYFSTDPDTILSNPSGDDMTSHTALQPNYNRQIRWVIFTCKIPSTEIVGHFYWIWFDWIKQLKPKKEKEHRFLHAIELKMRYRTRDRWTFQHAIHFNHIFLKWKQMFTHSMEVVCLGPFVWHG